MYDTVDGDGFQTSFKEWLTARPVIKTYSKRRSDPSKSIEPILEKFERLSPKRNEAGKNSTCNKRRSAPIPRNGFVISPPLAEKFKNIISKSDNRNATSDEKSVVDAKRRSNRSSKRRLSNDEVFDSFGYMADKSESESIAGSDKMAAKNENAIECSQDSGFGSQESQPKRESPIIRLIFVPKKSPDGTKNGHLRRSKRSKSIINELSRNSSTSSSDDNIPLSVLAKKKKEEKISTTSEARIRSVSCGGIPVSEIIKNRVAEMVNNLNKADHSRRDTLTVSTDPSKALVSYDSPAEDASDAKSSIGVRVNVSNEKNSERVSNDAEVPHRRSRSFSHEPSTKTVDSSFVVSHLRSIQLKSKRKTPPKSTGPGSENDESQIPVSSPSSDERWEAQKKMRMWTMTMKAKEAREAKKASKFIKKSGKNVVDVQPKQVNRDSEGGITCSSQSLNLKRGRRIEKYVANPKNADTMIETGITETDNVSGKTTKSPKFKPLVVSPREATFEKRALIPDSRVKAVKRKVEHTLNSPKTKRRKTEISDTPRKVISVIGGIAGVIDVIKVTKIIHKNKTNSMSTKATKMTPTKQASGNPDEIDTNKATTSIPETESESESKVDVSKPLEIITTSEMLEDLESSEFTPNGTRRKHTTPKKLMDYVCKSGRRTRSLGATFETINDKPKVKKEPKKYGERFFTEGEPYNVMLRFIKQRNALIKEEGGQSNLVSS